jgi:hypothetical protein
MKLWPTPVILVLKKWLGSVSSDDMDKKCREINNILRMIKNSRPTTRSNKIIVLGVSKLAAQFITWFPFAVTTQPYV